MTGIVAAETALPSGAVLLLLLQLALLLAAARLGAVLARSVGLPSVLGELGAGLLLGPSVFGQLSPAWHAVVFPPTGQQTLLLEAVGALGMVLLLLLTGLETDVRLLRNLGRAAIIASILGMVLPFALGFGLGVWMPDEYLAQPQNRVLFAAFLATAMSISAMPVIAKILMDLDLTRRNIGLVILSAGVVDDTAGWLILSVIVGAATHGGTLEFDGLLRSLAWMAVFIAIVAAVAYPVLNSMLRQVARTGSHETELVVVVVFALLCAATTEAIGVHAVFGAFVAGTVLCQVAHLRRETVQRLDTFVFTVLAPVFFGTVGLKVDLWALGAGGGGGGVMLLIVLTIATIGKLAGCTIGGLWGGLGTWEALSIAVAMNARGAMELVVASIGLSLGILNEQMFSIIVVVAIATSVAAPIGLRLTMRKVSPTPEETHRMLAESARGLFDPSFLRILVPTSGTPHALVAARIAAALAKNSSERVQVLHVDEQTRRFEWLLGSVFGRSQPLEQHVSDIRSFVAATELRIRSVPGSEAAEAVLQEAAKGYDLILAGASKGGPRFAGRVLDRLVQAAPCDIGIVHAGRRAAEFKRVLVPVEGSYASSVAAELALHLAEATGATLTLGLLSEGVASATTPQERAISASDLSEELTRISPVFRAAAIVPELVTLAYDPTRRNVVAEIMRGRYDLVVLGAENRAVRQPLFFGHENEAILRLHTVTTLVVVPLRQRAFRTSGATI